MTKTILITGATDGIGLETAKAMVAAGHKVLAHGRNAEKLAKAKATLEAIPGAQPVETYRADLSKFSDVTKLADAVSADHAQLDALINNAGIFNTPHTQTEDGLDVRFVVNTLAPYQLTKALMNRLPSGARVVNLSSAAQATVNLKAMAGQARLSDMDAYAQSKLAITMWTRELAKEVSDGPVIVAVNPGSLLASKMVKEGFGVAGNDLAIGADILQRAALSDEFSGKSGAYFDNDSGRFADPHGDALNGAKSKAVYAQIKDMVAQYAG
ncbi:MAG: SDR family NAD(P)-dependent oxidoreductase [Shimia sp.]|uniref:SDR family NAD(P)-dependent oxidoreductase n=1 Tax=Shimia sp. TaxID=1954381 RepID=UPI0040583AE1